LFFFFFFYSVGEAKLLLKATSFTCQALKKKQWAQYFSSTKKLCAKQSTEKQKVFFFSEANQTFLFSPTYENRTACCQEKKTHLVQFCNENSSFVYFPF
jgi:hypothetical protein